MRVGTSSKVRSTPDAGQEGPSTEAEPTPASTAARPHGLVVIHCEDIASDDDAPAPHDKSFRLDGENENVRTNRELHDLTELIKQRIRSRTSERVRDLEVLSEENRIVIRGCCATFYTKQLAQHAAMGVIEDEVVVNEISVGIPR